MKKFEIMKKIDFFEQIKILIFIWVLQIPSVYESFCSLFLIKNVNFEGFF